MKKGITTITLAATLAFGATFANADGIIVAGSPVQNCSQTDEGIIVAGKAIINAVFGIIVAGSPVSQCVQTDEGIIVAG